MLSGKRSAPWCDRCGTPSLTDGHMSHIGICPDCGEWALVDNLYGLTDPQSVAYKRWKVAYQISKPGRPKITTPTPAQLVAITSLLSKNRSADTP